MSCVTSQLFVPMVTQSWSADSLIDNIQPFLKQKKILLKKTDDTDGILVEELEGRFHYGIEHLLMQMTRRVHFEETEPQTSANYFQYSNLGNSCFTLFS